MAVAGPAIEVDSLVSTLLDGDRRFVLRVHDFRLGAGEAAAITGPSGSGKTLFLEMMGLLRRPDPGGCYRAAAAGGQDLAQLWSNAAGRASLPRLRGRLFGIVPQVGGLLPFLSARENVALTQDIAGRPDVARAGRLMDRLGISDVAALYPGSLSIGERQRVAIARALSHGPDVVLADEPTAALDPENAVAAMSLLVQTSKEEGAALLLSCHDTVLLRRFDVTRWEVRTGTEGGAVTSDLVPAPAEAA